MPTSDLSDALNPVLVKELRQGLKSRSFAAAFLAMQFLMVGCVCFHVLVRDNADLAMAVNVAFWACSGLPLVIFLPLVAIGAIHAENRQETMSLLLLTRLSPWRMVTGKWSALMAQSTLIASSVLPYVVIRYFLGGIDTVRDLLVIALLLASSGLLCAGGLFISTFRKPWTLFVRGLVLLLVLSPLTVGLFFPIIFVFYAMSARPDLIPLQLLFAAFVVLHGAAARFTDFRTGQRTLPRVGALVVAMLLTGCVQVGAKFAPCYIGLVVLLPLTLWITARAARLAWPQASVRRIALGTGATVLTLFAASLLPGPFPAPGRLFFVVTLASGMAGPLYLLLVARRWIGPALPANYIMAQVILLPLFAAFIAALLHQSPRVPSFLHIAPVGSLVMAALGKADAGFLLPNLGVAALCLLGLVRMAVRTTRKEALRAAV